VAAQRGAVSRLSAGPDDHPEGYACKQCGFKLWNPLLGFDDAVLGLYDDVRFPGRSLLVLRERATHLEDLAPETVASLMVSAAKVGSVIRDIVNADRINYAVLGNTESHVHVHIIPRLHRFDPVPNRPPWEHPSPAAPLSLEKREEIASEIVRRLRETD
jgi:diadenosine tetraphosphate (Ap4A) HIT family hydrolase